jgi:NAD(P)-dependent dehydrogenase (short-subunit alcohol dehydrogenase family)
MFTFADKTAIVTGGGSGIGRASAMSLAKRGANIIIADLNGEAGAEAAFDIEAQGRRAVFVKTNVADPDCFEHLRDVALQRFGRVDIVMNNVGVISRGLPEELPYEEWEKSVDVNFLSVVRSVRVFAPLLSGQGSGHIVSTASFAGMYAYGFYRLPYAAMKAAVIQLSEGLAIYLRPKGVGVTVLCPGPVATNISQAMRTFGPPTELRIPGPQFALLPAEAVGEQVADAIAANRFMLPTHDNVRELLVARASDWDAFLQNQIDHPTILAPPGKPN